jgi:hypothetical protein
VQALQRLDGLIQAGPIQDVLNPGVLIQGESMAQG